jgi:DNA-directed RNA polymerase subunit RPC12/RpoP
MDVSLFVSTSFAMSESTGQSFSCSACGARFALNSQVAERKIACRCGNIFLAPGLVKEVSEMDLPAADPSPPRFDAYPRRPIRVAAMDDSDAEFLVSRDIAAPIVLLILGLAMRFAEIPFDRSLSGASFGGAVAIAVFQVVLTVALMLGGVLIAAKILGENFGLVGTAILKFCGIAIFAWACGAIVVAVSHYQLRGFVIAMNVMFLIYFACFWMLFSLEPQEALITTAICALLQDLAALVVFFDGK